MKRKNIAAMATSIALVGVVAVGGTLALLTSESNKVTNTFAIGNDYPESALTLDEANVTQVTTGTENFGGYEAATPASRTKEGNEYINLVPDTTLAKDPTFHLAADSPDSWIVAKVDGINALKDKIDVTSIANDGYGWLKLNEYTAETTEITAANQLTDGYYVFATPIKADGSTGALFNEMTVQEAAAGADLTGVDIEIKGVAVASVTGNWVNDGEAVVSEIGTMLE